MKRWIALPLIIIFVPSVFASASKQVLEETIYQDFKQSIQSKKNKLKTSFGGVSNFDQSLYVDALWDLLDENSPEALKALDQLQPLNYELAEKVRIAILRLKYGRALVFPTSLIDEIGLALRSPKVDKKVIYLLAAYEADILKAGHKDLIRLAKTHKSYFDVANDQEIKAEVTDETVTDLFYKSPDTTTYMSGEYVKSVKMFMFCRENRLHPCLMVMRDIYGRPVRNPDGKLWSHKALASSKTGLPSYQRNGNTPTGIFTIDSVMPDADLPVAYGKFRRFMLNFVPKSKNDVLFKSLLPESSKKQDWWKPSIVARNMGRNLFRIHGTGKINTDPNTPYYPFVRTSGCIAQRENTYDGVTYQDQRDLLDSVMKAMDLSPVYDNEPLVKGILYVVEIDDQDGPVELSDLVKRGIE